MKCVCGRKDVIRPKPRESAQQYMNRKLCPSCRRTGEWRELSDDEARWD
jgi:hypothetical protein